MVFDHPFTLTHEIWCSVLCAKPKLKIQNIRQVERQSHWFYLWIRCNISQQLLSIPLSCVKIEVCPYPWIFCANVILVRFNWPGFSHQCGSGRLYNMQILVQLGSITSLLIGGIALFWPISTFTSSYGTTNSKDPTKSSCISWNIAIKFGNDMADEPKNKSAILRDSLPNIHPLTSMNTRYTGRLVT